MKTHYDEFYETFELYEHLCMEDRYVEAEEAFQKMFDILHEEYCVIDSWQLS